MATIKNAPNGEQTLLDQINGFEGLPLDDITVNPSTPDKWIKTSLLRDYVLKGVKQAFIFTFDSGTTDADPGSGKFRINNASEASATFVYISKNNSDGVDISDLLLSLASGSFFVSEKRTDYKNYLIYSVTGPAVDATTYIKIPVTDSGSYSPGGSPSGNYGVSIVVGGGTSIDLSFTTITANNPSINPTNQFNNYRLERSGNGELTFNATGVVDGNQGFIKIIKDNTATIRRLGFANPSLFRVSNDSYIEEDDFSASPVTITNAANNGGGLIRITAASHGYSTGDRVKISGVVGTTEANGNWTITVIDANTYDLNNSTFTNAYTSGGASILLRNYLPTYQVENGISIFYFVVQNGLIHINGSDQFDNV